MANQIIPTIQYKDAKAAIAWLCAAFGFKVHAIFEEEGVVVHAQLIYHGNMIMVSSLNRDAPFTKFIKHPKEIGGAVSQSPYLIVEDMDAHYQQAVKNGAKIALDLKKEDYGGKSYSCFDPEGHLWNFGSYDPWG